MSVVLESSRLASPEKKTLLLRWHLYLKAGSFHILHDTSHKGKFLDFELNIVLKQKLVWF